MYKNVTQGYVLSFFSSTVNTLQLKLKNLKMTNDDLSTQVNVITVLHEYFNEQYKSRDDSEEY